MTVSGIGTATAGTRQAGGIAQGDDAYVRGIRKQIESLQKELQGISSDTDLSFDEKIKKRQEIQQEIADLNAQIRQHQIEVRRQEQEKKSEEARETAEQKASEDEARTRRGQAAGVSSGAMQSVISAGVSMDQARVQSQVRTNLQGTARVLKGEIRQDAGQGGASVEAKKAALSDVEGRADAAMSAQMDALSSVRDDLHASGGKDARDAKDDNKDGRDDARDAVATDKDGQHDSKPDRQTMDIRL